MASPSASSNGGIIGKTNKTSFGKCSVTTQTGTGAITTKSGTRVIKTLMNIYDFFGNRAVSLCREMTKLYEQNYFGYINQVVKEIETSKPKGEFVIIIAKSGYSID